MIWLVKKLKKKSGESLLEALIAILVIAITSSILMMYVQSSSKINNEAKVAFAVFGEEMSAAEAQVYEGSTTIVINGYDVDVNYSGQIDENELHSYWR
ncbi:MAG: type II secretion system protein [Clostridia bacterium]|nr:type II secretion system protein [Clostridia bacterium]